MRAAALARLERGDERAGRRERGDDVQPTFSTWPAPLMPVSVQIHPTSQSAQLAARRRADHALTPH